MVSIPLFSSPKSTLPLLLFSVFTSRKLALQAPSISLRSLPPLSARKTAAKSTTAPFRGIQPIPKYLPVARPKSLHQKTPPSSCQRRSSITASRFPCNVSNSHSLLNSTIWFYDHQPRGDTWPYGTVTLVKTDCLRYEAPNGVYRSVLEIKYNKLF